MRHQDEALPYMQTAQPAYSDNCVDKGVKREPMELPPAPTYAQSKQMEKAPKPSLPAAPPNSHRMRTTS
jgi:hypothetical protein